jgi:transcriptional regulator with XRE-family HTH domain
MLIRAWRRRERITGIRAARLIGIHPSTLRRLESGLEVHGATLVAVLAWVIGTEERRNEEIAFEAQDATAAAGGDEGQVGTAPQGGVEAVGQAGAAIEDEPEAAAELPVHALDQEPAVCDLRPAGI